MCFSTILSRVLDKYFVYMPPTPLSNGPSVNKVLSEDAVYNKHYNTCSDGAGHGDDDGLRTAVCRDYDGRFR